jgi:hypothetical protein
LSVIVCHIILIGCCLYGLISSIVTLLTMTLPLPPHQGHGAGDLCGDSVFNVPVPPHSRHTAIRGGLLISFSIYALF